MRLSNRFTALLIPLFLLSALAACGSTSTREGTGEYVDDTVITTKVKQAIFMEDSLKSAEVNVETFKGVVQLSGFISSRDDMSRAVDVAWTVKGVKSVTNDMQLK